jgi:hypothetical protein
MQLPTDYSSIVPVIKSTRYAYVIRVNGNAEITEPSDTTGAMYIKAKRRLNELFKSGEITDAELIKHMAQAKAAADAARKSEIAQKKALNLYSEPHYQSAEYRREWSLKQKANKKGDI